ncbi:alpha-1,3-mannosyl-glycoprotein 2-beta-N-acetylglucosaminyltransferase [Leguminivora glycinivorella]|uniref:alpha-1,3-mannosyl-glycoprotein 2-beta-N-acetylglucosaminyltransferase n=1 Tax=Leguminivora glycinivorella TaxID=1035111 RepID=UPI00200F5AD2|nr:alpha-1,3-mannosyl-glycoprotein 2-beta-N-acetylglucosaminyltransferase [Leguminivora glycinivorella]
MRLYLKKFLVVGLVSLFIISLMFFYNGNDAPVSKRSVKVEDIETRINKLEEMMDNQLTESGKLLQMVVKRIKKKKEPKEDSVVNYLRAPDIDAGKKTVLPVLVIACDRVTVKRCLDNLIKFRPSKKTFPIIVSQDCGHNATYQVIKSFTDADPSITVVRQPDLSEIPLARTDIKYKGYYKIARHFKFALNHVFTTLRHQAVIIVEDDLDISPDFYEYFLGTYPLLIKDHSIWCVSAWNDNGKKQLVDLSRPELLHRTDFFPGLGWMLRADSWAGLEPNWPKAFFDDWLRDPVNTQGRACIRPEISRTYSFGKAGVSKGLFFDNHLRYIVLNQDYVEFTKMNLTYLLKQNYDHNFTKYVYSLPNATAEEVMSGAAPAPAVRVAYTNPRTYHKAAKRLGLMDDFRSGIPRTAYRGVVQCTVKDRRVYLAPDFVWTQYDRTWE